MTKKILVPVFLVAFASAPVSAASFDEVDTDKNGVLSEEEAKAAGVDLATADQNQDGQVDKTEFEAATGEQKE